jgi:hypothetical protein
VIIAVPFPIKMSVSPRQQDDISSKANVYPSQSQLPTATETDASRDDSYSMTKKPSGLALVINNKHFHPKCGMNTRKGTDVDAANLKQAFTYLGFLTEVLHDQGTDQMFLNLRNLAQYDHRNYDCVVVCILTHGIPGKLYGSNGDLIEVQKLVSLFNGDQAPTLVGKPKLFFLQACRGDNFDYGQDESDGPPVSDPIIQKALGTGADETDAKMSALPVEADMLLAYATVPGYVSWRNSERGSWFIQALTEVLVHDSGKDDVTHMMITVNRKVATEFEAKGRRKQMPAPVVQLLKKLYFRPGQ